MVLTYSNEVFPEAKTIVEDIASCLQVVFGTRQGERLFHPEFGGDLAPFAFEMADSLTLAIAEDMIREQIQTHIPHATLLRVTSAIDGDRLSWNLVLAPKTNPNQAFSVTLS